jgi:hypothetical protein
MLHNFNQFINESKEDEFNSLVKGDIVLHRGHRCKVTSVAKDKEGLVYSIGIDPAEKREASKFDRTLNLSQFKQQVSGVIKKEKTKKEEDED